MYDHVCVYVSYILNNYICIIYHCDYMCGIVWTHMAFWLRIRIAVRNCCRNGQGTGISTICQHRLPIWIIIFQQPESLPSQTPEKVSPSQLENPFKLQVNGKPCFFVRVSRKMSDVNVLGKRPQNTVAQRCPLSFHTPAPEPWVLPVESLATLANVLPLVGAVWAPSVPQCSPEKGKSTRLLRCVCN